MLSVPHHSESIPLLLKLVGGDIEEIVVCKGSILSIESHKVLVVIRHGVSEKKGKMEGVFGRMSAPSSRIGDTQKGN